MDTSKLKNFIIIILLLLNAFLLILLAVDEAERGRTESSARLEMLEVLSSRGVTLLDEDALSLATPSQFVLNRSLDKELSHIRALLGKTEAQDQGGNIYRYVGERGEASFRGTGEFVILLDYNEIATGRDMAATARGVLKKLGIKTDGSYAEVDENAGGGGAVTLRCSIDGAPVYNCSVIFTFTPEYLLLIDGKRILDEQGVRNLAAGLDVYTLLARFLDYVRENGIVCSEIRSVELGYNAAVSGSGGSVMTPVWRIETDGGIYFLNGLTGAPE